VKTAQSEHKKGEIAGHPYVSSPNLMDFEEIQYCGCSLHD